VFGPQFARALRQHLTGAERKCCGNACEAPASTARNSGGRLRSTVLSSTSIATAKLVIEIDGKQHE